MNPWTYQQQTTIPTSACTGERSRPVTPEDPDALRAKGMFFQKLTTMPKFDRNHPESIRLENIILSMVEGELSDLNAAILAYKDFPRALVENIGVLAYVFKDSGVSFLETEVFSIETDESGHYQASVIKIWLRHARRVVYLPTDSRLPACIYSVVEYPDGRKHLKPEPAEEPRLIVRQIGRVLRQTTPQGPPPLTGI